MTDRRMFNKKIVRSDKFLDMPLSTQALYFQLGMEADDDGFLNNSINIMRLIGANKDDFNILLGKQLVYLFDDGIIVITDWNTNNFIRKERHKPTEYQELKKKLFLTDKGKYLLIPENDIKEIDLVKTTSKRKTEEEIAKEEYEEMMKELYKVCDKK